MAGAEERLLTGSWPARRDASGSATETDHEDAALWRSENAGRCGSVSNRDDPFPPERWLAAWDAMLPPMRPAFNGSWY